MLIDQDPRPETRFEPLTPAVPHALKDAESIVDVIAKRDVLLHHPYESFDPVVRFIQEAAEDPSVLAIKQTLYRTSGDSPIVRALYRAAENGKQVTVLVEIKARFDEANNIDWARRLEENGVHVVYGLIGLKTHCKAALVVRREGAGIRRYVHLGTGNYNPTTARQYTDLSLFTARPEVADDVSALFNLLTGYAEAPAWKKLAVAPFTLQNRVLRAHRSRGGARARGRAGAHRRQDERAGRPGGDPRALRRQPGRRRDRPPRARDLLPASRGAGRLRAHPRHQHRRPLPRAQPRLRLRRRRSRRGLPVVGRLDAAQLHPAHRGDVPRRGARAARAPARRGARDRSCRTTSRRTA